MKLLYLIPSMYNPGGMERILTEKVNYLVNQGYDVTVLTTEQEERPYYFVLDNRVQTQDLGLNFNSLFTADLWNKYWLTKRLLLKYRKYLEQYILDHAIDICISMGGKELEFFNHLNVRVSKVCELHFGRTFRTQFLTAFNKGKIWKWIGRYRTFQLMKQTKYLDALVVLTKQDQNDWNHTHSKVYQIYNFVDTDQRRLSDFSQKRVVAVGKLDPQKGFDMLIDCWAEVNKVYPDWCLDIYGQGEYRDSLQRRIQDLELGQVISLKGISNDVNAVLETSSIFVLSSRYEGFPMVMLEAISCGVPCVAFDCKTGPNEIIEEQDCGLLVPNGNVQELAEGIKSLISDPELLRTKGKYAVEKSSQFSKETIMKQWMSLFIDLNTKKI